MQQIRRSVTRIGRVAALLAWFAGAVLVAGCASTGTGEPVAETPAHAAPLRTEQAPRITPPSKPAAAALAPAPAPKAVQKPSDWNAESSLWDRIRAGFTLDPLETPLVAEKERFYLARPDLLERMFQRGGRYLFHIVEELERRGMPTEIALLPFVESAMNPVAVSPAQAAGLWQFVPATGRQYNLHQNWWVDNRRDPVKSTRAALDYLQKIHAMHGDDWFLALASYNWGENAVARAVKKNQGRGLPTDYLSLEMPAETRHYVPKLIALKNIIARSAELGLTLPALPNRPYFVTIEKTRPIDLKLAAQFAGMSVEEFVALNPAHNRPVIAASKNNQIKLPADRKQAFLDAVARHEEAKKVFASWQPYTLKKGESLDSVAGNAGVSAAEIRRANGLKEQQRIVAGTRIIAPQQTVDDEMRVEEFVAPRIYEQIDKPAVYHTVGNQESIGAISQRYGISAATLAAWNGIKQGVRRGMKLLVQPAATQTLLTTEEGNRSVVAIDPKPGFVKVSAASEGATSEAPAVRPRATASREPDRHAAAAKPAAAVRVVARPAASVGPRPSGRNAPENRTRTSTPAAQKAIIRTSLQPAAQDGRRAGGGRNRGT